MRPRLAATLAAALVAAIVCVQSSSLGAQAVFQVEGGGNTITGGYGSRVQFWSGAYEGWISAGYWRGWRLGLFAKRPFGLDTLRLGFDAQPIGLATDLFSGGSYLLTQGVTWRRKRPGLDATLFGGATGSGAGAPFVNTARADKPLGLFFLDYKLTPALQLQSHTVVARRQTLLQSISWRSNDAIHQLAATAGVGSNKPFGSLAWRAATERVELRAGYTDFANGFRRADAPMPNIAEPYRENVLLTLRAPRRALLTLGHQNFRQEDTVTSGASRATVDQAVANVALLGVNLGGGVFQTTARDGRSLSTFSSINRGLPLGASATVMLFQTFRRGMTPIRTVQAELRERITHTLNITQVFSQTGKSVSGGLGGTYQNGFTTIGFDYQNYYVPLRQPNPFMRALNLTVRLQIGNSSANIGSSLDPFGRVTYTASGSTYLYLGEGSPGVQPITVRFERYVIRGIVVDDAGNPIDGAAVDLGGQLAMTNSRGEFFVRTKNKRSVPLKLSFSDFVAIGDFEVVRAPNVVNPEEEDRAEAVRIVLRSVLAASPSKQSTRMLGIQQGSVRATPKLPETAAPALPALPPAAVPLPSSTTTVQGAAGAQCTGVQAMLRDIYNAAATVAGLPGCCRARDGWRMIERPLPIKPF